MASVWFLILLFVVEQYAEEISNEKIKELHRAASVGNDSIITELLNSGLDPDSRLKKGGLTPLYLAASGGFKSTMTTLMDKEANVEAKVLYQNNLLSLLSYAVAVGNKTAVNNLLRAGANANNNETCYNVTIEHYVLDVHYSEMIEFIKKNYKDIKEVYEYVFYDSIGQILEICQEEIKQKNKVSFEQFDKKLKELMNEGAVINTVVIVYKVLSQNRTVYIHHDGHITNLASMKNNGIDETLEDFLIYYNDENEIPCEENKNTFEDKEHIQSIVAHLKGIVYPAIMVDDVSSLHHAVNNGNIEITKTLLKNGADVNAVSRSFLYLEIKGKTISFEMGIFGNGSKCSGSIQPLALAAYKCNIEMVELLLNHSADMNGHGADITPVLAATDSSCDRVLTYLIKSMGASVNTIHSVVAKLPTTLFYMQFITEFPLKFDMKKISHLQANNYNLSALHIATSASTTKILLEADAEINSLVDGFSALKIAIDSGNVEVVKVLLNYNANIELLVNIGSTFTGIIEKYQRLLKLIQKTGIKMVKSTFLKMSVLSFAVATGNEDISKLIIAKNDSLLNPKDADWPPLHIAVLNGNTSAVIFLEHKGANMSITDSYSLSAIDKAILKGDEEIVSLLIGYKVNISATDRNGWTPFHIAAQQHQLSIAQMLIDKNSNIDKVDKGGFSALIWTEIEYHPFFTKLLIEKTLDLSSYKRYRYFQILIEDEIGKITKCLLTNNVLDEDDYKNFITFLNSTLKDVHYVFNYAVDIKKILDFSVGYIDYDLIIKNKTSNLEIYKQIVVEHFAYVEKKHVEMMELLINKTTEVDKQDSIMGWGVIHWAAACGDNKVMELLVKKGANINEKSILGHTPLYLARYWKKKDIYMYLKGLGAVW